MRQPDFILSKNNDYFLLDSKTEFSFSSYVNADDKIEWECCCTFNGGGRGWLAIIPWHTLFCLIYKNLCHSESALITTDGIIVICRQALILLMILLCSIIIWKPLSAVASGLQHLDNSKLSSVKKSWWTGQPAISSHRLSPGGWQAWFICPRIGDDL